MPSLLILLHFLDVFVSYKFSLPNFFEYIFKCLHQFVFFYKYKGGLNLEPINQDLLHLYSYTVSFEMLQICQEGSNNLFFS